MHADFCRPSIYIYIGLYIYVYIYIYIYIANINVDFINCCLTDCINCIKMFIGSPREEREERRIEGERGGLDPAGGIRRGGKDGGDKGHQASHDFLGATKLQSARAPIIRAMPLRLLI